MTTVIFGNHTAVRARREDRDRIRAFYRDVLGCTLMREFDDKDDFRMGDAFHLTFVYASGGGAVDQGVSYAPARSSNVMQAQCTYENVHADESPISGAANEPAISRGTRRRRFDGEISGEGTAEILVARGTADRLGYVATERFVGSVQGKSGTFLLQHGSAIDRGELTPFGYIVPGTGTGELAGIRGEVRMTTDTLMLTYDFER